MTSGISSLDFNLSFGNEDAPKMICKLKAGFIGAEEIDNDYVAPKKIWAITENINSEHSYISENVYN